MKYQFVGTVAGAENATVRATVTYLSDYRDPDGQIVPPVLLFERRPGQEWTAQPGGGAAVVYGPNTNTDGVPRVRVAYTVLRDGLPPFSRVVERRIMPNTDLPGYWDWMRGDVDQPPYPGGTAQPTPIEVLPGQGPQGERGPGLLLGAGVPNPEAGRSGDSYLNTATWDVYSKAAGNWALVGNIRGATGGVGPRGEAGLGVPHMGQFGDWLFFGGNGPEWRAPMLADLMDVDLGGLRDGQTLVWSAARQMWVPGAAGSGTTEPPATGLAITTDSDGYLTSDDPRITTDPDGYLSAPDELIQADENGYYSEV